MLVSTGPLIANMGLLLVMGLLRMMRMRLGLVLLCHVHLHIPLVPSAPIHHHMLPLLVRLIEHAVGIMVGRLRDRRAGWRGCLIAITSSCIIDRRSIPREMAVVMILLVMLRIIILASRGLLEPVRTICHGMRKAVLARSKRQSSLLEQLYLIELLMVLGM